MSDKPSLVQRELKKASAVAKQDAGAVSSLASEAAQSGAYLYPLYGIVYFARNPKLFASVKESVYKGFVWSAVIVASMFFFTYLPQVAVLSLISGPLAFIAAIPVVLAESYVITTFLVKSLLISGATDKIFDAVLVQKGFADLVERGRKIEKSRSGGMTLGASLLKPISSKFSTEGLWRYLVTLPLNFIPGVGTALFLFYNGLKAGPSAHNRYFQLKEMDKNSKDSYVESHKGAYASFGAVALALGLVPVVGTFFSFSNAVGAALYAADLEKQERAGKSGPLAPGKEGTPVKAVEVAMGRKDEL